MGNRVVVKSIDSGKEVKLNLMTIVRKMCGASSFGENINSGREVKINPMICSFMQMWTIMSKMCGKSLVGEKH